MVSVGVSHLGSTRRANVTSQVAYHPVGHLGSARRANLICQVAYHPAGYFANTRRANLTSQVAYHPIGHLPRGTKSSTNAIPKRAEALTFNNCLHGVELLHCNYRDNEELSNDGFVFARHVSSENTKTRLDNFHVCCISQCIRAPPIELFHTNTRNTTQMKFAQTCFCISTRHMSSENKTAVGQFFIVSVFAMSKLNTI